MLRRLYRLGGALALLALAACGPSPSPSPPKIEPVDLEAGYRLSFNGTLVGHALFTLRVQPDGRYLMEAYTIPSDQLRQAAGHEVLETSSGTIGDAGVRPRRFQHSVMQDDLVEMVSFVFDWERGVLKLVGQDSEQETELPPGTHDRLSYLLTAYHLALAGEGTLQIQIASPGSADETRLEVMGKQAIQIPLGSYTAVGIRRVTAEPDETRALWFEPDLGPLPVRIVHIRDGNTVEMLMESLNPPPRHPR
ncbi:MAG: DUF3108 domain-containing protein [Sedimenticolaceae bacterium]